jgi:chemotaxis protein MotB
MNRARPILIIKKKVAHGGHHGGAWKVAYADFVTAMMALFIVLWIVGQSKSVKEAISSYFKDPGAFSETTRNGGVMPGAAASSPSLSLPIEKADTKIGKIDFEKKMDSEKPSREIESLKAEGERIKGIVSAAPLFEKFKDRFQVIVSDEGLRIELIENSVGLFFDVGSANLKPETVSLLKMVASELGKLPNPIIIEGYTDARPYGTESYTNWELRTDRANKARKILEDNGLRKDQVLEVRGFADRKLKTPQDPLDTSNRRVSIFLPSVFLSTKTAKVESPEGPKR